MVEPGELGLSEDKEKELGDLISLWVELTVLPLHGKKGSPCCSIGDLGYVYTRSWGVMPSSCTHTGGSSRLS